jgi:hypothetical protein
MALRSGSWSSPCQAGPVGLLRRPQAQPEVYSNGLCVVIGRPGNGRRERTYYAEATRSSGTKRAWAGSMWTPGPMVEETETDRR